MPDTARKKQMFLDQYPTYLRATKTAIAIGITEWTHYDWLKHDEDYHKAFTALKKKVDADRLEVIEAEIYDRSLDRDAYGSSVLLMFQAKAYDPDKYREKVTPGLAIGDITIKLAIPEYDPPLKLTEGEIEGEVVREE